MQDNKQHSVHQLRNCKSNKATGSGMPSLHSVEAHGHVPRLNSEFGVGQECSPGQQKKQVHFALELSLLHPQWTLQPCSRLHHVLHEHLPHKDTDLTSKL